MAMTSENILTPPGVDDLEAALYLPQCIPIIWLCPMDYHTILQAVLMKPSIAPMMFTLHASMSLLAQFLKCGSIKPSEFHLEEQAKFL